MKWLGGSIGVRVKTLRLLSSLVCLAWGCGGVHKATPAETAEAYAAALRADDITRARALSALPLQGAGSLKAVLWRPGSAVETQRHATWGFQEGVALVSTHGAWLIRHGVLGFDLAFSPEVCVAMLANAIEARDPSRLMRILPEGPLSRLREDRLAEGLSRPAWRLLAEAIRAGRVRWVDSPEGRARALVDVGSETRTLDLGLEGGDWKVFDVRPWSGYLPQ
jgi:hypothetical protein